VPSNLKRALSGAVQGKAPQSAMLAHASGGVAIQAIDGDETLLKTVSKNSWTG
jgi:hypothetical protein